MTPLEIYLQYRAAGTIENDDQQLVVMQKLDEIHQQLEKEYLSRQSFKRFFSHPKLVKGLYLWGGVGIGKTFMMDCFYQALSFPAKLRMHFHPFMQQIHQSLTKHQGEQNPLQLIAKEIAEENVVLCFDEFFVSDITDAMLLGKLLKGLFEEGVCLIATSNTAPDELYKHGLQRSQFLPAIEMIKKFTCVIGMETKKDYRLRHLTEAGVFYTPLNDDAKNKMEKSFAVLTSGQQIYTSPVQINGRIIPVIKRTQHVIWFDFKDICHVPRSQKDYLAIASSYQTVFIQNIPVIQPEEKDTICLFISMIDVFYDARVKLVLSAAESVQELYNRGFMTLEYTRTNSRLLEMQSVDYFTGEFNHATTRPNESP